MNKQISRRELLKKGAMGISAVGVSSIALPSVVKGATGEELATLIDIRKCIGCGACVEACQEINESKFADPQKPFPSMSNPQRRSSCTPSRG